MTQKSIWNSFRELVAIWLVGLASRAAPKDSVLRWAVLAGMPLYAEHDPEMREYDRKIKQDSAA